MNKAYSNPVLWKNYPSTDSPLNETNLLKMGNAIDIIDDRVCSMDTTKLDKVTALEMVKSITLNEDTGVFTITYLNGSTATIDTKLEKLAVNFSYDSTNQRLIITLDDGTKQYVDMKALVTQYEFVDSNTLTFSVDASGKITATIKKGSITADMLQPNFLADVTAQANIATQKAEEAYNYAAAAKASEDAASASEQNAAAAKNVAIEKAQEASGSASAAAESEHNAKESEEAAAISEQNAAESEANSAQSEEVAIQKASDASQSAQSASNSKNVATSKASEALTQANRAEYEADRAAMYSSIVAPGFYVDFATMILYMKTGVGVDFIVTEDNELCWKIA